ncbi:hypothetical protein HOLleu_13892 [Holothuria leucospilota]|uniref:Uncharacterized protein n=1 Tax=Holothuria leucospilota TaxID=206669 RepID=A0A9Q1C5R0_HOLLE|nr:hypothetical protein HOLleu_13892 [Holothuria leucospilota]
MDKFCINNITIFGLVTVMLLFLNVGYCQVRAEKKIPAAISKPKLDAVTTPKMHLQSEGPPQTECMNYNLKIGMSNIHYYTCCGGLQNSSFKLERQYANFHCNPTRLRYAIKNTTSHYDCNGEEGQQNAKQRCSERWGWIEEPVDCWMWSDCFAGACKKEVEELGSSAKTDVVFCGDGRCDANTESSSNCPIDCCPIENPTECVATNNTCPNACCGDAFCCNGPISATQELVQKFWMILLGILAGLVVLVNVICCCCCYCCYSKCCKKERRCNDNDIEMPKSRQGGRR